MDLQSLFAERIGGARFGTGNEIYKFEKIKRAKRRSRQAHPERQLLDFGVGEPDDRWPTPAVREALKHGPSIDPANRGYADNGVAAFKEAAAAFTCSSSSA
jgi:LL-diaminopimelate aminotransferase